MPRRAGEPYTRFYMCGARPAPSRRPLVVVHVGGAARPDPVPCVACAFARAAAQSSLSVRAATWRPLKKHPKSGLREGVREGALDGDGDGEGGGGGGAAAATYHSPPLRTETSAADAASRRTVVGRACLKAGKFFPRSALTY